MLCTNYILEIYLEYVWENTEISKLPWNEFKKGNETMISKVGLNKILEDLEYKTLDWILEVVENDMNLTVYLRKFYLATFRIKFRKMKENKFSR